ncbi:toll/interleukin-1 receptor domain-containing protein [Streptomyces rubiginosohelvolus]|uniref:toll/interleukin-1 receptor domain-containing protein n=1 Tax=Streptomyces rubiginosohelvolus TaxID=67362 RepID=UPI0036D7DD11
MGAEGAQDDGYDVFISYSQNLDRDVAAVFQRGMENFGRPWYRPVRLRVFRDTTHLSAGPDLQGGIEKALSCSAWLIVMASPQAAASPWVRAEIDWWVAHKDSGRILLAWTDGDLEWDPAAQDFDWSRTDALPREQMDKVLAAAPGCPRWVDLRWLRAQIDERGSVPVNDPRLVADVAEFAAPVQGRSKSDLIGHHLRLRKRRNRTAGATILALALLLTTATWFGLAADRQADIAATRQLSATSRQLVAEAATIQHDRPDLARQLLVEAYRLSHTEQAVGALLTSSDIPRVVPARNSSGALAFVSRSLLVASSGDGLALFDVRTGAPVSELPSGGSRPLAVAVSSDGRLLAEGGNTGEVRIWDLSDRRKPRQLSSAWTLSTVRDLAFDASASVLVVGSGTRVAAVDVRDPARPRVTGVSSGVTVSLGSGTAISPDGTLIATGAADDKVRILRVSGSGELSALATVEAPSAAVAFSPSGHLLATAGEDRTVRLWDMASPRWPEPRTALHSPSESVDAVAFAADGRTLATGDSEGAVHLWDVSDPFQPRQGEALSGHTFVVNSLAFSPDGRSLASAAWDTVSEELSDNSVRLWNVHGARRSSAHVLLPGDGLSPQPFAPTGGVVATGRPGAVWKVDGVPEPRRLATLPSFRGGGQDYAFSPDGRTLAAGHPLSLWDVSTPARIREHARFREVEDPQTVVFGVDGRLLAAREPLGAVRLWDVGDPDRPRSTAVLPAAKAEAVIGAEGSSSFVFAGDRALIASVRDRRAVQLWDVSRPDRPVRRGTVPVGPSRTGSLAATADGGTLFVGDARGGVTVWDITDARRPKRLGASQRHSGAITHLAADPVRDMLAGVDENSGAIRLWDVSDPAVPREIALLAENGTRPTGLAFSPDGGLLAVSSDDGTQLWRTDVGPILQQLCAQSAPITEAQWKEYLPDRPYDPPCA